MISKVEKRNGKYADFDIQKIENAIYKALTFTKEGGKSEATELSEKVLEIILRRFSKEETPHVEEIQNIVEEVLISEGLTETARSYILYREKRREIRESAAGFDESTELIEKYIDEIDWQVKENANMTYSLQGLNQYATSYISKKYWLNKIYPEKIREAAKNQDFHIHDLNLLATYCSGWDLHDLLFRGFGGVSSKVESKPPKHFRPALGQVVNFFFTLQGEGAGAQAMSNFDTLLAPFIRKDNLDYKQVKQSMQEFVFNCMVPTRVGFQCLSQDTEILTKKGWKNYNEVEEGELIKTFNIDKKIIEEKKVKKIFKRNYEGKMYRVLNRIQDQLISPGHRMVRKKFNTENYCLETVEDVLKLKTSQIVSIAADNNNKEIELKDEEIKLIAWIISEGSMEAKGNWRRVMIYQSREKNKEKYEEILSLLKKVKLKYSLQEGIKSLGDSVMQIRFDADNSKKILRWFDKNDSIKRIPKKITEMSQRQSRLFLETYIKGDGHEGCKITVSDKNILNDLQRIIVNAGYGFTTAERMSSGVGNKLLYILRIIRKQETRIREIKKVNYSGVIWSVNTDNETVIAKRNGKVFITGNTPFLNISLDVRVPEFLKNQPIIIGGEPQKETYGDFQKEMDIFNKAFYEVLMQGDAKGRVFTFPIPTISITKDFDWENETLDKMWEATAKYGINYFSNFVQSDMNPEDFRSMCCRLRLNNQELIKRGGGLFGSQPLTGCYDEQTEVLTENGWKFFKDVEGNEKVYTLSEDNNIELHKPFNYFEYKYDGEMYKFKAKSFDLLVTPNHRMVVDRMKDKKRTFIEAQDFKPSSYFIPKGGVWKGIEKELFTIPSVKILKGIGPKTTISQEKITLIRKMREEGITFQEISREFDYDKVTIFNVCKKDNYGQGGVTVKEIMPDVKIEMDDWLRFFGIWIAEGCTDNEKIALNHGYRTIISQNEGEVKEEIENLLKRMPFKYSIERRGEQVKFIIFNKQLWTYLRQFGNKYQKFIPRELKNLSKRQIKILFDWMVMGDGHVRKTTGQINYWTSSKKLADDIQEMVLKLGWMATSSRRKKKSSFFEGRKINSGFVYNIGIQQTNYYRFRKNNISKEYYKGNVYCLEVTNNTLFVRRRGKVSWCGNSVGVVTINIPRIGYLSKTKEDFYKRLTEMMDLAKESLELKRKVLDNFIEKGLYPYTKHYLTSVKKMRGSYFGNHFSTIGLIGMNEALLNFMGKNIATKEGKDFALEVLKFMRDRLVHYQEETGNLYNLEATPGEGASFRQARTDRERYSDIITAGTKEAPYYTNSVHLPVNYTDDPFEALDLQDELQQAFTGGTVIHLFLGERVRTPETAKNIVRRVFDNYHLPYITLSPTFSICSNCGYIKGESPYCPNCRIKGPKKTIKNLKDYRLN
jgi:ribonucleoside-triphosphate reductase (formate)